MAEADGYRRRHARMAAVGCLLVAVVGLAGCAVRAGASPAVELTSAYVPVPSTPGTTVAYVVIRNNGPADRLVAARTSAGGRVLFRAGHGTAVDGPAIASVPVPAHATLRMAPGAFHMVITGAGPLRGGKAITLTLVFARAGPQSVVTQITNPESGGSSYFLN